MGVQEAQGQLCGSLPGTAGDNLLAPEQSYRGEEPEDPSEGVRLRELQTETASQVRGVRASAAHQPAATRRERQPFIPDPNTTLRFGNKPSKPS